MRQLLGVILGLLGVVLIVWGVQASDSFSSDVSRFFTGNPTDKTMWLLFGGAASAIVGLILVVVPGRSHA